MTPMEQALLNDLKKENEQLKDAADSWQEEFDRVDDAAEYWKNEFEQFYNAVHRAINLDSELYSDGEVIDIICNSLKTYGGQSDEQHEVNW